MESCIGVQLNARDDNRLTRISSQKQAAENQEIIANQDGATWVIRYNNRRPLSSRLLIIVSRMALSFIIVMVEFSKKNSLSSHMSENIRGEISQQQLYNEELHLACYTHISQGSLPLEGDSFTKDQLENKIPSYFFLHSYNHRVRRTYSKYLRI